MADEINVTIEGGPEIEITFGEVPEGLLDSIAAAAASVEGVEGRVSALETQAGQLDGRTGALETLTAAHDAQLAGLGALGLSVVDGAINQTYEEELT